MSKRKNWRNYSAISSLVGKIYTGISDEIVRPLTEGLITEKIVHFEVVEL